ncbi:Wall-associated protein precursor [Archangium violaceum]|uniref:Wall-associated protein precursor n=1 Tax=Archangium violaceum TaxID=83451 RepID=UPI0036DF3C2D
MFASLLVLLLTQLPSTPNEPSVECLCDPEARVVDATMEVMKYVEQFSARNSEVEKAIRKGDDILQDVASDCSEPIQCTGQLHHIISRLIAKALATHRTLKGQYKERDPRFVSRAVDEKAHCGYQQWHRDVDAEVVEWLKRNRDATTKEFEAHLREIYNRPDMLARFPHGF